MDNRSLLVANWLTKAQHDLTVAKRLKNDNSPLLDVAIYHCQQAAEKAVKGFLVLHDQWFPKTHDIRLLLQLAIAITPDFSKHEDSADLLTPYATEFRYPGDMMDPTIEETEEATIISKQFVDFVISLLPDEIRNELKKREIPL
ncbi:MAG: hypothetical protein COX19_04160 [Desulfobacterales bacterium CG23_combo_of_CG06-09_8_20_14_all_51_8]|nr:MAG: hypothetical protein COX19_04160 [Desulfobacterales bacterium CG23_combo_of_CG06-09_8_20_14_all_51_8]